MKVLKSVLASITAIAIVVNFAGCSDKGTSSATSDNSSVTSSDTTSENTSSTDESKDNGSEANSTVNSEDTSSKEEIQLVQDGRFILPNGKLSFKLQEDYTLISDAIVYQFGCETSDNKFNLTVSTATQNIEEVKQDEMTKTYETTMQDFKLVTFEHITIKEKPAIKMQLTGKLYGIEGDTMLTQYMIQSGTDAYCFTFTQTDYYNEFADIIDATIDSLEIK